MGEKFSLRQPDYPEIDLAAHDGWKWQPRDAHGRWAKSPASKAAEEVSHTFKAKISEAMARDNQREEVLVGAKQAIPLLDKKGALKPKPSTLRVYRHLAQEHRRALYKEAGLKLKYADKSEEDLLDLWHNKDTSNAEREEIHKELEVRMKRLSLVARALDQSITDAKRENSRDWFRKWDDHIRRIPGGHHIIELRERLLADKFLDKTEPLAKFLHEHGSTYTHHVATAVAIGMLLHPLGLGLAGVVAGVAGREAMAGFLDNMFVESGIATALTKPLEKIVGPIFAPLTKEHRVKVAKKVVLKDRLDNGPHVNVGRRVRVKAPEPNPRKVLLKAIRRKMAKAEAFGTVPQ